MGQLIQGVLGCPGAGHVKCPVCHTQKTFLFAGLSLVELQSAAHT